MQDLSIASTIACETWRYNSGLKALRNPELVPEMAAEVSLALAVGRTCAFFLCAALRKKVFAKVEAMTRPPTIIGQD